MGWKKPWWQSVACPDDVDNEQEFRQGTCMPGLVNMHGVLEVKPGSCQPCLAAVVCAFAWYS